MLKKKDHRGYIKSIGNLGGDSKKWEDFNFKFTVPKGATYAILWIHRHNNAIVDGYLDDIDVCELKNP